jgi:hypothetical protein
MPYSSVARQPADRRCRNHRGLVDQHMQQQTGVPPIIRQQVQPPFMQAIRQSQQSWIMSQQALSPLVQVTQQPSFVISTLQAPIVRLQVQTIMPFILQQTLHIPPAIMAQRFCIIVQAAASSHMQVIFIPPEIFSSFMVQRGTITMLGAIDGIPMPVGIGLVFSLAATVTNTASPCPWASGCPCPSWSCDPSSWRSSWN